MMKYLKGNIAFEPLVCRWYAWPFLVPPAAFSLVLKNRLLPIIESFVEDPDFHRSATRNPRMRGGPFVDFDGDLRLAEQVLADMKQATRRQAELADVLVKTNEVLIQHGKGNSLEPVYECVPAVLRGYVELGYDLNNHASMRLIEPLLYRSKLYDPSLQSVFLRAIGRAPRPFVMSTPLFDTTQGVLVNAPFADPLFDELARARRHGLSEEAFDSLRGRIEARCGDALRLADLFTETPPARQHTPPVGPGMRIRYFGHATLLMEANGTSVMIDPSSAYEMGGGIECFNLDDLPASIDYVLLTHNHQDHVLFEFLLQLRHKVKTIVVPRCNGGFLQDPSLKMILEQAGFESVIELDEMGTLRIEGGSITGLPFLGEHCDLHIRTKLGYCIELDGVRAMCLADSDNLEPAMYQHIADMIEPPDVLFIGMECEGGPMSWLYGSFLPRRLSREHDESRRLSGSDFTKARRIVDKLHPRAVFVYAMGAEPWFSHITSIVYDARSKPIVESDKLIEHCRRQGMVSERLFGKREIMLTRAAIGLE